MSELAQIICADPAWKFASNSKAKPGRNAMRHYPCMSDAEICALPVKEWAAKDAMLFMWTTAPTHGPGKMALWDGTADTYVAGHRHNHAEAKIPNGWRGKTYQLVRVRGYKDRDAYAEGRPQFPVHEGMEGRSALLVVNPQSETHDGRQRVFMDMGEGLEFLQMLKRPA